MKWKKYKKWIQGMKDCSGKGIPISISRNVISFNGIKCTIKMFRKWIQVLIKFDATIWSDSVSKKGAKIPLGSLWKPFCQPNSFEDEWNVFSAWRAFKRIILHILGVFCPKHFLIIKYAWIKYFNEITFPIKSNV